MDNKQSALVSSVMLFKGELQAPAQLISDYLCFCHCIELRNVSLITFYNVLSEQTVSAI